MFKRSNFVNQGPLCENNALLINNSSRDKSIIQQIKEKDAISAISLKTSSSLKKSIGESTDPS